MVRRPGESPQTKLAFHAKMNGVAIRPAKEPSGAGRFELGLIIEQPSPPSRPTIPWEFADGADRSVWKSRPTPEGDGDEAESPAQVDRVQARYDAAREHYDEAMKAYAVALDQYRFRVRSYAELCGIAAVFGNQHVSVVITPANQDLLPGFAAELPDPTTQALLPSALGD